MLTSTNEVTTAIAMKQEPGGIAQENISRYCHKNVDY